MANIQINTQNETLYNQQLESLITRYNDVKTNFSNFNPDFTLTSNCINDAKTIITDIIKFNKDNRIISYNSKDSDDYFHKTFLSLLLPFGRYTPLDNGKLIGHSANCKFTIADVNNSINNQDERIFIKVVEDVTNRFVDKDHLIYDVIACIIFNKIFSKNTDLKRKYEKNISEYRGCFCSYNLTRLYDKYWNYNEIIDYNNNDKSPYYYKTILGVKPSEGYNIIYKDPVLNIMYKAINDPISVWDIFVKKIDDNSLHLNIFKKCYDLYEFIKEIGLNYGFMHNDLHFSNILYDQTTNELVLIDFGRSSFGKYIDNYDEDLINKIRVEYQKIHYDKYFPININRTDYLNSNLLEKFLYTDQSFFKYAYSTKLGDKYFSVILDLITFSLNLYIRLIYYLIKNHKDVYDSNFKHQFEKLIEVNYLQDDPSVLLYNDHESINISATIRNVEDLVNNYREVKQFIDTNVKNDTKKIFTIIAEGLFYTALYILYIGPANIQDRIYTCFQILDDVPVINNFKKFVKENVLDIPNYRDIISNDSFLQNFLSVTGGEGSMFEMIPSFNPTFNQPLTAKAHSNRTPEMNQFDMYDMISKTSRPKSIRETPKTLSKTSRAYEMIFNNHYDLLSPIKHRKTIGGSKKGGKRILKKY